MIINAILVYQRTLTSGEYHFKTTVSQASNGNIIVTHNGYRLVVYTEEFFIPGDVVVIKGIVSTPIDRDNEAGFNSRRYLLSKRVSNTMTRPVITKVGHVKTPNYISYKMKESLRINKEYQIYIDALVFGEKLTGDVQESIQGLGVGHLFAVSGLHINLIASTLSLILLRLFKKKMDGFVCGFLVFYMFFTSFAISVVRASLLFIIPRLSKDKEYDSLPVLSIMTIAFIIWNPYIVFSNAFVFSFFVSFVLIVTSLITSIFTGIEATVVTILIAFVFTVPIVAYYSFEVNLFSIVHNFIMGFIVVLIILPLAFLTVLVPFVSWLVEPIFIMFNTLIGFMNVLNLSIVVGRPSIVIIIAYYFMLLYGLMLIELERFRRYDLALLPLLICCIYLPNKLVSSSTVTFFDVGNADSVLIHSPQNGCNALIDIGETTYSNNIDKRIVPFLKRKGIEKLDFLFLTHDHYDHYGQYTKLRSMVKIGEVVGNKFTKLQVDKKVGLSDRLKCGALHFDILNPSIDLDTNNNSLVIYLQLDSFGYLFLGDVTTMVEEKLLPVLSNLRIDVVKIAHHGSNTSTSTKFISTIRPKYGIISVGKSNYDHPSISVLSTLNLYNVTFYSTINEGYIVMGVRNKQVKKIN